MSASSVEKLGVRIGSAVAAVLSIFKLILATWAGDAIGTHPHWDVLVNQAPGWRSLRIAGFLVVSLIAIWRFQSRGFVVSSLMVLAVIADYAAWYILSLKVLEASGAKNLQAPSAFGLYGAMWLDIAVLATTLVLAVWLTRIVISALSLRGMQQ